MVSWFQRFKDLPKVYFIFSGNNGSVFKILNSLLDGSSGLFGARVPKCLRNMDFHNFEISQIMFSNIDLGVS